MSAKFILCLLITVLLFSGCSYSAFEDSLRGDLSEAQEKIEDIITPESEKDGSKQETEIVNGVKVNVDKPEKEDSGDIIFKNIGESFEGYEFYKYNNNNSFFDCDLHTAYTVVV